MKTIKRIKVKESIALWNDKNKIQIKKTATTVSANIAVKGRSLSLWNNGKVPKQVQALYNISKALDCNFDDLFDYTYFPKIDTVIIQRIAIFL